ncbi:hypothetical protein ACO2I2_14460 [Leptospira terpstrae]
MVRLRFFVLSVSVILTLTCIGSLEKENLNIYTSRNDYGYVKFRSSQHDGRLSIRTKIFQDPDKCFSENDCYPKVFLKEEGFIHSPEQSFPIQLNTGIYYAISKVSYVETSFQNCKWGELKIYHGFQFKEPFDPFQPLVFYYKESCEWIGENTVICPTLDVTKDSIFEIELKRGITRSSHYSLRHWVGQGSLLPLAVLYCGFVSESIDFLEVKVNRFVGNVQNP